MIMHGLANPKFKRKYNNNLRGPVLAVTIFIMTKHKIFNIKYKTYITLTF